MFLFVLFFILFFWGSTDVVSPKGSCSAASWSANAVAVGPSNAASAEENDNGSKTASADVGAAEVVVALMGVA